MRRIVVIVAALLALVLSGCSFSDLTGIGWQERPTSDGPQKEVIVYYTEAEPYLGHPSSEGVILEYPEAISTVIGFWWQIDRNTFDRVHPFSQTTDESILHTARLANERGIRVEGLFHNLLYGRTAWSIETAANLLSSTQAQERLIADVIDKSLKLGLSGVNIDIENVPAEHRNNLTAFVERAAKRMREAGLEVSIAVPSKTWDDPHNGWSGAFDYRRIGEAVDRVILMTYDEHGFVSGPGPIASSPWVENVVKYAVSQIPAEKVFVGLAGYGFDWPTHGSAAPRYISYRQAIEQSRRLGVSPKWDNRSNTPHYTYWDQHGNRRDVWFEDAASSTWKLDLVDKYGLGGVALWRGGLEDPQLWQVITQKYRVVKY